MFTYDITGATSRATLLKSQAVTADTNGPAVDLRPYRGKVMALFNIAAATAGTTPTMDVKIQDSADGSTGWTDVSGYTGSQVTTVDSLQVIAIDTELTRAYVRAVFDIGGTASPSFPCSAAIIGFKQRVS
jgi:hypothetical protein